MQLPGLRTHSDLGATKRMTNSNKAIYNLCTGPGMISKKAVIICTVMGKQILQAVAWFQV
jgi:hypothetical protein